MNPRMHNDHTRSPQKFTVWVWWAYMGNYSDPVPIYDCTSVQEGVTKATWIYSNNIEFRKYAVIRASTIKPMVFRFAKPETSVEMEWIKNA